MLFRSEEFLSSLATSEAEQLARYAAVIHLRTPAAHQGYNHQNPLRTESATVAAEIDERILQAWQRHPRRFIVDSSADFLAKAAQAFDLLIAEVPGCCRGHVRPDFLSDRDRQASLKPSTDQHAEIVGPDDQRKHALPE